MRTAFIDALCEEGRANSNLWLVTGDLGYSVLEKFRDAFPDRFINAGVAEQNMIGVAAGLAGSGKTVFVYSIVGFAAFRGFEQIRNDACYHNLNVNIVGVGAGLTYGSGGYSHHGVEDISVMRALPNICVVSPCDPAETKLATRAVARRPGPSYLRITKGSEPVLHKGCPEFMIGHPLTLENGNDVLIVATGSAAKLALDTRNELVSRGIKAAVVSMHTLHPICDSALESTISGYPLVVTVEEHSLMGGLHSIVLPYCARESIPCIGYGLPQDYYRFAGSPAYILESLGLTAANLGKQIAGRLR